MQHLRAQPRTARQSPASLALDEAAVERLAELVTAWALVGLAPPGLTLAASQEIRGVATKIPFSRLAAAYNKCLKFNRPFEKFVWRENGVMR